MPKSKRNPTKLPMPPDNSRKGRRPGTQTSTGEKPPRYPGEIKPGKPFPKARLGPEDGLPAPKHEGNSFRPAKSSGESSDPAANRRALEDASHGKPVRYKGCQQGDGGKKK